MKKTYLIERLFSTKTVNRIFKKNKLLGSKYNYNPNHFLINRLLITILVLILAIIIFKTKFILIIVITIAAFYSIEYFFYDYRLKKRAARLDNEAMFFFQILSLTLESGNNLKNAIELTSNSLDNDLSLEFKKVGEDIKMGKSLAEALDDLKRQIPSETINNIILNLTESSIYGSNMIESLNTQIEYLNDKLLLSVKEKINKMPVKISIASVLIFIPIILLIILSPIFINLVNS